MCGWKTVLQFSWNGTMLPIAVTLQSNFLHLVTSSQTALVIPHLHICTRVIPHLHICTRVIPHLHICTRVIPHLHICTRVVPHLHSHIPCHLPEHLQVAVTMQMNCFHTRTKSFRSAKTFAHPLTRVERLLRERAPQMMRQVTRRAMRRVCNQNTRRSPCYSTHHSHEYVNPALQDGVMLQYYITCLYSPLECYMNV